MHLPAPGRGRWLRWISGSALLVAVIVIGLQFAEAREFAHIAEHAEPRWLALAVLIQVVTYAIAGQVFRSVLCAAGERLNLVSAGQLALAKIFVDHTLPSAGLSGSVALANGLERRGVPRSVVAASIVVHLASHYAAHVFGLALALTVMSVRGDTHPLILLVCTAFFLFGVGLSVLLLVLSGRGDAQQPARASRLRPLRALLAFVRRASPRLARSPRLLLQASAYQLCIIICDATTLWVLIRALGAEGSVSGVFASFMLSNVVRLVAGLAAFEAASLVTLKLLGVPTAVALAASLLFHGVRVWLPMLAGAWFSRRALAPPREEATGA